MSPQGPEDKAREEIDRLLAAAVFVIWRLFLTNWAELLQRRLNRSID